MGVEKHGESLKSGVNEGAGGSGGSNFVGDLAKCLDPLTYGFRGYESSQLKDSTPLLIDVLNKYFRINEDGVLELKNANENGVVELENNELLKKGVNILGDGKFYVELNPHNLSLFGAAAEGLNIRRGYYIDHSTVYEAQRNRLEDPDSKNTPEQTQGNVLGKVVGTIQYIPHPEKRSRNKPGFNLKLNKY